MNINFNKPMHVYFIGIGGVSMSGLASILLAQGFKVSGSDAKESELTKKVASEGATVYYGQEVSHITGNEDLIVYTAAIREGNPEFTKMMECSVPHMTRAEFLGELMRNYKNPIAVSGTHGKTTTSSMISEVFLEADLDPTVSVGGVVNTIGSNMKVGGQEHFVFEACEYTNSYLSFYPRVSVILNIEEDHLDFFKDLNDIRSSFKKFANLLPKDGLLVINGEIDNIAEIVSDIKCPYVTYGFNSSFDYYATDIEYDRAGLPSFICHEKKTDASFAIKLGVPGVHNVSNALSVVAVSKNAGIANDTIVDALLKCTGSKRRFERKGEFNGVTVIDDYAHHPTEIRAMLNAALKIEHNKIWAVFQPHTYTRTKAFLHEFAEVFTLVDKVILTDVYAAREKDEYGCNSKNLYEEMKKIGVDVTYISDFNEIVNYAKANCMKNDMLITIGAGDVVNIGESLISK